MVLPKMSFWKGWIRRTKQLYEYYYLKKNEIKKLQKNISPELLASFGRQLTKTEDIKVELAESINSCQ